MSTDHDHATEAHDEKDGHAHDTSASHCHDEGTRIQSAKLVTIQIEH